VCGNICVIADAVKHARLYKWSGEELGLCSSAPVAVQVDNSQALSFQKGTCVQSKLRGTFDIRAGWVQELRNSMDVVVEKVDTDSNLADLLTKVHKKARYLQLLNSIGNKAFRRKV